MSAPRGMLYLGAQANVNDASGDKHISYVSAGQSISPIDNPREAFNLVFPGVEEIRRAVADVKAAA